MVKSPLRIGRFEALRGYVVAASTPQERQRVPPPLELPEAHIRWGKPSSFVLEEFRALFARGSSVRTKDDEGEHERLRIHYQEEGRGWVDFRVENPDDAEQYAIVRSTADWAFSGPAVDLWAGPTGKRVKYSVSGAQFRFKMNPNAAIQDGDEEGEGQEPPAPPTLDDME